MHLRLKRLLIHQPRQLIAFGRDGWEIVVIDVASRGSLNPDFDPGRCEADQIDPKKTVRPGTDDPGEKLGAAGEGSREAEGLGEAVGLPSG